MIIKLISNILEVPLIAKLVKLYMRVLSFFEKIVIQFLVLFFRLWMAQIFWLSGLTKISSWHNTIALFKEEYKVPFIPPEIAAYLSTTFELSCPILLVLGFATRLATLPMLGMTAVIEFTYLDLVDHKYWAMLLCVILFYGPGYFSVDNLIRKKFAKLVA